MRSLLHGSARAFSRANETRADFLERLFVDEGCPVRYLRRRFGAGVAEELLTLGLEVEGRAPAGCASSWEAPSGLPPQRVFESIDAAVVDFMVENPRARRSRLRMYP